MKENKKNGFLVRLIGLLVLACVFTACFVGGTMAKYVTSGSGSDDATVAKWGVTVTASNPDALFAEKYEIKPSATDALDAEITYSVQAAADTVAPGTSGSMAAFTIAGTPEVAVNVKFEGKLELGDKWVDSGSNYYCPIEITVGSTTFKGTEYASATLFETAVNEKIATYSKDYEANTDLSGIGGNAPTISWAWAFSSSGDNDVKDTYLGNQAAAGHAATIKLSVTVTVTQID